MALLIAGAGIMAVGFTMGFVFAVALGASLKTKVEEDG